MAKLYKYLNGEMVSFDSESADLAFQNLDLQTAKIGTIPLSDDAGKLSVGNKEVSNLADGTTPQSASTVKQLTDGLNLKVDKSVVGQALGVVPLGADAKIPSTFLPAVAITDTFPVATEADKLLLDCERGDVAVVAETAKTYILRQEPASNPANWMWILTPASPVQIVNGKVGNVQLNTDDVPEGVAQLYFTDNRAKDAALSSVQGENGINVDYDNVTKILKIATDWNTPIETFTNTDVGNLALNQIGYIKEDGTVGKADNTIAGIGLKTLVMCREDVLAPNQAGKFLIPPFFVTTLNALTPGKVYYLGTEGNMTETPPSTAGTTKVVVAKAVTASKISFVPDVMPVTIES